MLGRSRSTPSRARIPRNLSPTSNTRASVGRSCKAIGWGLHTRLQASRSPCAGHRKRNRRPAAPHRTPHLKTVVNARPDSLPLGIKQRLQLAVAVLHEPAILILDEPTSGVDPIARDAFWRTLIDLSRDDGVTIFVTTHFMNEADRCDRISSRSPRRCCSAAPTSPSSGGRSSPCSSSESSISPSPSAASAESFSAAKSNAAQGSQLMS